MAPKARVPWFTLSWGKKNPRIPTPPHFPLPSGSPSCLPANRVPASALIAHCFKVSVWLSPPGTKCCLVHSGAQTPHRPCWAESARLWLPYRGRGARSEGCYVPYTGREGVTARVGSPSEPLAPGSGPVGRNAFIRVHPGTTGLRAWWLLPQRVGRRVHNLQPEQGGPWWGETAAWVRRNGWAVPSWGRPIPGPVAATHKGANLPGSCRRTHCPHKELPCWDRGCGFGFPGGVWGPGDCLEAPPASSASPCDPGLLLLGPTRPGSLPSFEGGFWGLASLSTCHTSSGD